MCGIAGIASLSGSTAIDPEIIRRMADAIFHRGPDEDGYFFRAGLAMANRRLSIVGLADGRQPISGDTGRADRERTSVADPLRYRAHSAPVGGTRRRHAGEAARPVRHRVMGCAPR